MGCSGPGKCWEDLADKVKEICGKLLKEITRVEFAKVSVLMKCFYYVLFIIYVKNTRSCYIVYLRIWKFIMVYIFIQISGSKILLM